MHSKAFSWVACTLVVMFALSVSAFAQEDGRTHFSGIISDFTPAHDATGKAVGPWEIHGEWHLKLERESGKADFSGVWTMENSDLWLMINPNPPANPDVPATRTPHTHHVTMEDATVSYDLSVCPSNNPATTTGFVVSGMASILANGNVAPFQAPPSGALSPLQVCVTGGQGLELSNVTLVFSLPASKHFGSQPIHGVVRAPKEHHHD
jgi:hypothetical protein